MSKKNYEGVYWNMTDSDHGPYGLRISGTSEFVSGIDPDDPSSMPPGSITTVEGWDNPLVLNFDTLDEALEAGREAWIADNCHISVESLAHVRR